jgi:hypothetical protein
MSHYDVLHKQWIQKHNELQRDLLEKHKEYIQPHVDKLLMAPRQLVAGSVAGLILLTQPVTPALVAQTVTEVQKSVENDVPGIPPKQLLIGDMQNLLPDQIQPLTEEENVKVAESLSQHFQLNVSHNLGGKPLNRTYGIIGAEQHLMRYPGDTMATHFDNTHDAEKYFSSGMAPGRGAWGYFASPNGITEQDVMREKYYIAVQTFLAPGWSQDIKGHYEFYKFRKMLVVNPENGKAVVAVIGDSGPAQFTGKHLGGSPEVMIDLERVDGSKRGPVLYFFIDDPDNSVPLGPIEVKS